MARETLSSPIFLAFKAAHLALFRNVDRLAGSLEVQQEIWINFSGAHMQIARTTCCASVLNVHLWHANQCKDLRSAYSCDPARLVLTQQALCSLVKPIDLFSNNSTKLQGRTKHFSNSLSYAIRKICRDRRMLFSKTSSATLSSLHHNENAQAVFQTLLHGSFSMSTKILISSGIAMAG